MSTRDKNREQLMRELEDLEGDTVRSQRLLLALSQAAQSVLRARTPAEVYRSVGEQVSELGYQTVVFRLSDDCTHLALAYTSIESRLLQAAERMAGIRADQYHQKIEPGDVYDRVIGEKQTAFIDDMTERMTNALPQRVRPVVGRITSILGFERAVYAPLIVDDEVYGMLAVVGVDLTEDDVPAVTTFASQAAIALENAQLYEQARERTEEALRESEERYRNIVETAQEGIWTIDAEGNTTFVNATMANMLGYTAEEMAGQHLFAFMDEEGQMIAAENMERRRQGIEEQHDFKFRRKDGSDVWALISTNPLYDDAGNYAGALAMITDITERKRMEQALREREATLSTLLNAPQDTVALLDPEGLILSINENGAKRLGGSSDELIGTNVYQLLPPHVARSRKELIDDVFRSGEPVHFEDHRSGMHLANSVYPIFNSDGETVEKVAIFASDITKRVEAEMALERQAEELARSNAELEQFAYVASHDLQEPLRMVASYLQLLERRYKDQLDADAHDFIDYAVDGAQRMQTLINDLLAYSRVGTHGKEFVLTDCDAVLSRVLSDLQMTIEENEATVTHDPLPAVMADDVQLAQLFQNLISNAIKFQGEAPPEIHVGAERQDDEWLFSVRDNGIGIDPQDSERIFVIFQRLRRKREYTGTGIGLAICKRIVERHGGQIWVGSEPGAGSTFYFTLPAESEQ